MGSTLTKRSYTVSDKVRAAGRQNLEKARAVGHKVLYRRTEKRLPEIGVDTRRRSSVLWIFLMALSLAHLHHHFRLVVECQGRPA